MLRCDALRFDSSPGLPIRGRETNQKIFTAVLTEVYVPTYAHAMLIHGKGTGEGAGNRFWWAAP